MTLATPTLRTHHDTEALTRSRPDQDWWFVRAYPGSSQSMDQAILATVPWVQARAEEMGANRWFFMRYLDTTGHHVRLRIQAAPDALDAVHNRIPELNQLIQDLPGPSGDQRLIPGAELGEIPGKPGIRPAPYAPELEKYGGAKGFNVALDVFHYASCWSAEHDIANLHQPTRRTALARHFQRRLLESALPGTQQQASFWAAHRKQWGAQLRFLVPTREAFSERLAQLQQTVTAVELSRSLTAGVDDLVAVMTRALDEAETAAPLKSRQRFLLELMHMEMNRWGLMPAEECLIGFLSSQTAPHRSASMSHPKSKE